MDKTDIPGTFSSRGGSAFGGNATSGVTLGPVNETNMARIWNKHKQSNAPLKPHTSSLRGRRKVFVGLSGGVDSSVAAYLLKKQGYDVVGVFIKSWDGLPTKNGIKFREQCRWREDRRDAMRVAAKLKIPFLTYDFMSAYRNRVIEYFFNEHEVGRTPNPDIMCNKEIKFKLFLERALNEGADFVATGHYVRLRAVSRKPEAVSRSGSLNSLNIFELLQAKDSAKDQSYFLWTLTQRQLARCLFPIGEYTKTEVREMAGQADLPTAKKPDSQGICFIGEVPIVEFLRTRLQSRVGAVITADGRIIGEHEGAVFYTIGQRHGLKLSSRLPYYVCGKDIANNIVRVAEGNDDPALYQDMVEASEVSWVNKAPRVGNRLTAKIRYRQKSEPLTVIGIRHELNKHTNILENVRMSWLFKFDRPQRAVTPGQSIVLYEGERVVGGGVIM